MTYTLERVKNKIDYNKIKNYNVVAIGGGTGLSTMLRGLKNMFSNITAIVTVSDDGGSSGFLRQDLGMLPPGDIRNCILSLAQTEPIMEQLLQYRFEDGTLKGQSFGNLFLAAMNGISNSFEEAVKRVSDVLAVKGRVLPVSEDDITLGAILNTGEKIFGETNIVNKVKNDDLAIKEIYLLPENARPLDDVIYSIKKADAILLGPGSLYTSLIPNLLVKGVSAELRNSKAVKIYICNIMTQPGETKNYSVMDHINALEDYVGGAFIDYCIINNQDIPLDLLEKYHSEGADIIKNNIDNDSDINFIDSSLVSIQKGLVRHDAFKLTNIIGFILSEVL